MEQINFWLWGICVLWGVYCLLKVYQWRMVISARREYSLLPLDIDVQPTDLPTVEIIVPARNEEENIEKCLNSILAQDYENFFVTMANDRSSDETASIASKIAKNDSRLTIRTISELPDGWGGKAHAMWSTATLSHADWLLFVDADVTLESDAVRLALIECQRRNVNLLTLFPKILDKGFWLPVTIPFCASLLSVWFQPHKVNNPNRSDDGFVNGQFLLIKGETYKRLDGHRSVRNFLSDDVPFGQIAKKSGEPIFMGIGSNVATVDMYQTGAEMINGWTRIFAGSFQSRTKIMLTVLLTIIGFLPYPVLLALFIRMQMDAIFWSLGSLSLLHILLTNLVNWQLWDSAGCAKKWLWFYPLSILVSAGILIRSWWWLSMGKSVVWKDVEYKISPEARIYTKNN